MALIDLKMRGESPKPRAREGPADGTESPLKSLKRDAFFGTSWTVIGQVLSNLIRMAGNLALTRILYPEAFGVMALVNVFIMGLQVLSDIGLPQCIIQSKRGSDMVFLNTAWTVQVLRGSVLWLCSLALARPFAEFYKEDSLKLLIPVTALSCLISGFSSTSLLTLNREIKLGKLTVQEILSQFVGLVVMIALSFIYRSVWALVWGGLVGAAFKTIASYFLIEDYRNRWCLEKAALTELFKFGVWMFVTTALCFFLGQSDRLILGRLGTMTDLCLYSIALFPPQVINSYLLATSHRVLLPLYSKLSDMGQEVLCRKALKIRAMLFLISGIPLAVLTVVGPTILNFLYDQRYRDAGPYLQIISAGSIITSICLTSSIVTLALGDSFRYMLMVLSGTIGNFIAMFVGYELDSVRGVVIGASFGVALNYPFIAFITRRRGMWQPMFDFCALAISGSIIALGLLLKSVIVG